MKFYVSQTIVFLLFINVAVAQKDTLSAKQLHQITISSYKTTTPEIKELSAIHQTYITSGKKSEVITVQDLSANVAEKTGRQIFAKIPGAFIYDMDGAGNQINIATRGLDPHRSWEYNVRQNGVMTNSDIYAYPASHYSAPMEAIQKIEIIRGTASLQFGSQFGGMINYITKQADTSKILGFESLNSIGSYGLLSSFNALGGKKGKFSYYAYYHKRVSNGYRENARSEAQGQFISLNYAFTPSINLKAELGRSQYLYQIPGALTDAQFYQNPRQATRKRNYFSPDIYLPSLTFDWKINKNTTLNWITSSLLGNRSSVQFIAFADVKDTIDAKTLQYKPRQVDIDNFNSYTSELRLQHDYSIAKLHNTLSTGIRYINNNLHRRQQGKGTTATNYDLSITTPNFGRDIYLKTQNIAFFIENLCKITSKLEISTGVRLENGVSKMSGFIAYLPNEKVPQDIKHNFALFGISTQYRLNEYNKLYGGLAQAYRPAIFSDIIPATALEQTDPNLKDAFGYNAEIGIKGKILEKLTYDVNFFQILYKNRIGSLILNDANNQPYVWKTNIGNSKTNGLELYLEYKIAETNTYKISIFTASSYFDGFYLNGKLKNGNENTDLTNKRLETVPKWISRNGLQIAHKKLSSIIQYNYVSESFSDAFNTTTPSANGAKGIVPEYSVWDFNMTYKISSNYMFKFGVNNITNKQYFTKRPAGYPGQGVWASDGRSLVATVSIKL